jgi:CRP-like cAMP-binding protein
MLRGFAAGEVVYNVEDPPGGIFGTVAGGFGISVVSAQRGPELAHVVRQGAWFGTGPVITRRPRVLAAHAFEESVAWHVPLSALDDLRLSGAEGARSMAALSDFSMDSTLRCVSDLLRPTAAQRIAAVLLRVTAADEGMKPDQPEGWLITQAELALMSNASRQLVNRTLATFEGRGWLRAGRRRMLILDAKALSAFAEDEG